MVEKFLKKFKYVTNIIDSNIKLLNFFNMTDSYEFESCIFSQWTA